MTKDLTEQWKKGELEAGEEYWVRLTDEWKNSIEQVYFNGEDFERFDVDDIDEVLAPVPSYEEWKASYNCVLENEVLRLKNAKLKELLKECREVVISSDVDYEKRAKLALKLYEVLK